jgi:aminoglycoside phosphotransferase
LAKHSATPDANKKLRTSLSYHSRMIDQDAFASLSMERAFRIAAEVTGQAPSKAKRFANGMRHYVFEVEFPTRRPVVVRIGSEAATTEMAGAVHLSAMLRQRGVPLPTMLASNVEAEKPWLVLERLAGTDLGNVKARRSIGRFGRFGCMWFSFFWT